MFTTQKLGIIFLLTFLLLGLVLSDDDCLIMNTSQGPVKGFKRGKVFEFYGIPYATAPKGQDKFKAPLPAPTWQEPLDAVVKNIVCPQAMVEGIMLEFLQNAQMTEDCLIANVYRPDTETKNLPVVVYVHGGAYQLGSSGMVDPNVLVEQGGYIVVTFNYRLGIHGFLCLGTKGAPGNAGMKDQIALLKWVKKNIASFGGNPDDVTIDGFSAGSSSVDLLVLSEMARGLFHKVIPESGAALGVWSIQQDPLDTAKSYARTFNITTDSLTEVELFYKTTPLKDLMIDAFLALPQSTFVFVPCVERDVGSERFLKDAPLDILKKGDFAKVPMLIGFSNMEGKFRLPVLNFWKNKINTKFSDFLPVDMTFNSQEQKENVSNILKKHYFGDKPVGEETIQGYVDYFTDVLFSYSILQTVKYYVEAGNNNVYLYEYSYVDDDILSMSPFKNLSGADHCGQTFAVLESLSFGVKMGVSENYAKVKQMMRQLWYNFVWTGKPVPEPTPAFPQGWPASSSECAPHMSLNFSPELKGPLLQARMKFWEHLYGKYYRTPIAPEVHT